MATPAFAAPKKTTKKSKDSPPAPAAGLEARHNRLEACAPGACATPTKGHKALARGYYVAKGVANAAKNLAEKERQALLVALDAAEVTEFELETTDANGGKVRLEVLVETPDVETIDMALLKAEVDDATFQKIITATKKNVQKHAGKSTEVKCTKVVVAGGTRNVSVDPKG